MFEAVRGDPDNNLPPDIKKVARFVYVSDGLTDLERLEGDIRWYSLEKLGWQKTKVRKVKFEFCSSGRSLHKFLFMQVGKTKYKLAEFRQHMP